MKWFSSLKMLLILPSSDAARTAALSTLIVPLSSIFNPLLLSVVRWALASLVNSFLSSLPLNDRLDSSEKTEIILLYPDKSSSIVSTIELSSVLRLIVAGLSSVVLLNLSPYAWFMVISLDGEYCSLPLMV